jgi:hypothetical protein
MNVILITGRKPVRNGFRYTPLVLLAKVTWKQRQGLRIKKIKGWEGDYSERSGEGTNLGATLNNVAYLISVITYWHS